MKMLNLKYLHFASAFLTLCTLFFPLSVFSEPKPVINLIEEERKLQQRLNEEEHADGAGAAGEEAEDEYDGLYKVELLVFAYVNTGEENSEIWRNPSRPSFDYYSPAYLSLAQSSEQDENSSEANINKNKYRFLDLEDSAVSDFGDIKRKMAINGHYRVLQHLAWQQKVLEERDNDLFYLEGGDHYPDYDEAQEKLTAFKTLAEEKSESNNPKIFGKSELAGTIKLYRSRYLHIKPDLWFTEFVENDAGICHKDGSITASTSNQGIQSYTALTNFHINQHRRLRSGEIHYIDHPRFGFLIKFTSVEKPKEEPIETPL